jgi:hypothetical protein
MSSTTRPLWHGLLMGTYKAGKTTVLADARKPLRVVQFDPVGNEAPLRVRCTTIEESLGTQEQRVLRGFSKKGELLLQIDQFFDFNPDRPTAWVKFKNVQAEIAEEVALGQWATVGYDGATSMELAARNWARAYMLDHTKATLETLYKIQYAWSKAECERYLCGSIAGLPCDVVVLTHIDEDKDYVNGTSVRNPKAPGTLRTTLGGSYTELYRVYYDETDGTRRLQTQPGDGYNCGTSVEIDAPNHILVPNGGRGVWAAIWSTYEQRKDATHGKTPETESPGGGGDQVGGAG